MRYFSIHEWVGLIFLLSSGFSSATGSLVADPPTLFLACLTVVGIFACENLLGSRRRRVALPVVSGQWRN
jgi:hypothetical protein